MSISTILPNLYLGNQYCTSIAEVDVIISIGCNPKVNSSGESNDIIKYKFSIQDSSESDMIPVYEETTALISQHLSNSQSVLVHCKGGINRSPMVVMAYLCKYCDFSIEYASLFFKSKRKSVRFQAHYLEQLQLWLCS